MVGSGNDDGPSVKTAKKSGAGSGADKEVDVKANLLSLYRELASGCRQRLAGCQ